MLAESAEELPAAILADDVVLCGANALTSRMAEELTARYGLAVAVIVPSATDGHSTRMAAMPGVSVLAHPELTVEAFQTANLTAARGLAILNQDDLGNLHAALRAQDLRPDLRLVIAIVNAGLGEHVRNFLTDCAVLSEAQMAAPSLVAAALGEPALGHARMAGRTIYVTRRENAGSGQIICGLAASSDADAPSLVPPDDPAAGLVLAVADGTPRNPLSRQRPRRLLAPLRLLRRFFGTKLGLAFAALVAILGVGFALLAVAVGFSPLTALYLTFLDAAGAAVTQPSLSSAEKLAQFLLTFDGMAFLPLVTAVVVGARLTGSAASGRPAVSGHVIVAGLGSVGALIIGQLHDLGIEVVGVDKDADATGMPLAKRLGIRVVIGDTHREETLRAAGIQACQAIVSVTDSDIANLETALNARALAAEPRVVVRLYDDDLAARVQRTVGNTISRSTSYLAAGTGTSRVDWSPHPGYLIGAHDRLVVLATRTGLSGLLRRPAGTGAESAPPSTSGN